MMQQDTEKKPLAIASVPVQSWGELYGLPLDEMRALGVPIMNLGPSGEAPHKKDERLHLRYSLDVLPELLYAAIREIAKR